MRFSLRFSLVLGLLLGIAACSNGDKTAGGTEDTNGIVAIQDKLVSGVSQKGPFVNGSSVTMQELDPESFGQTGKSFEGKIKNDQGEFAVQVKELVSPYALLKANGFYRNEVSGERSTSQVTLYTITDLTDRDLVNVNLLTHLEYERSVYLVMHDSLTLANAKSRAKSEVLKAFYIDSDDENSEDLNIFGSGDGNAALLSISIMMQSNLKEAAFSERLANFASDLEDDGVWEDSSEIVKIADWSSEQSLSDGLYKIRQNIESWNIGDVPGFEKHIKSFWWNVYGLGLCSEARKSEVLRNQNEKSSFANVYFICKDNKWLIASDLEKDTYKWNNGADGESKSGTVIAENCYVYEVNAWRSGNVSDCTLGLNGCTTSHQNVVGQGSDKVWYTCDEKTWRSSTTYEKDTYGWKSATDGTIRKGNVTDTVYVFDKTVWRMTNTVESKLGGCVPAIKDSVGEVNGKYYICKGTAWAEATAIEYDTYKWSAGKDADSKSGSVNTKNCYVYENTSWRAGNASDCSLGLNGCTASQQNVVGQGSDKVWYTCDEKTWRISKNIEKDTVSWGAGENGEVRAGQVNTSIYYIYEISSKAWREASVIEKDTYDYENNRDWDAGTDGEIRKGSVTSTIYVYDVTKWRAADAIESSLGGCVDAIQDSIGKVASTYYVCNPRKWKIATTLQYDTYRWISDTVDGAWKKGVVNKDVYYVYDKYEQGWRNATTEFDYTLEHDGCTVNRNKERINVYDEENEVNHYYVCYNKKWYDGNVWTWDLPKDVYLNPDVEYGTMTDERDGQVYKTVQIGTQVWMAENLNYADSVKTPSLKGKSWCYGNVDEHCNVAGRLYTWAAAIDSVDIYEKTGEKCGYGKSCDLKPDAQGICPKGWHLPSYDESISLFTNVGGTPLAGKKLKSNIGWNWPGDDELGFAAFPVGLQLGLGNGFDWGGGSTHFWTASDNDERQAKLWYVYAANSVYYYANQKYYGLSVRCVMNVD